MSRFTDPLLFFALTLISAVTWWILAAKQAIPATEGALAPMTVAVAIVIAAPALALVTVLALVRSIFNVNPRPFWAWVTGAATLGAVLSWVASLITYEQEIEVGFGTSVWLMGIVAVAGLIAFILALTGAIPTRGPAEEAEKVAAEPKKTSKLRSRRSRKAASGRGVESTAPIEGDQASEQMEEPTSEHTVDVADADLSKSEAPTTESGIDAGIDAGIDSGAAPGGDYGVGTAPRAEVEPADGDATAQWSALIDGGAGRDNSQVSDRVVPTIIIQGSAGGAVPGTDVQTGPEISEQPR